MSLSPDQRRVAEGLLKRFVDSGMPLSNQGTAYPSYQSFDKLRAEALPPLKKFVNRFLDGEIDLQEFKQEHNALSIKYDYWGFTGFSGQMTLNQLTNWSHGSEPMTRLLRETLRAPTSKDEGADKINRLLRELPGLVPTGSKVRRASLSFVMSYFWQLQHPDSIPVYYTSSKKTLSETGLLTPTEDFADNYRLFWSMLDDLADEYARALKPGDNKYWFVEHVLWAARATTTPIQVQPKKRNNEKDPPHSKVPRGFEDFVPPRLADLTALGRGEGSPVEFELRTALAFQVLGFEVAKLGQGTGRNPDGIAYCREHNYAILFDAKGYKDGYGIGVEDRSVIEYIKTHERELRSQGYSSFYFCFVSASFRGNGKTNIDRIRRETATKSVVLLPAENLLRLVSRKIERPRDFDLGDFQDLLLNNGELGLDQLEAFWAD